MAPLSKSLLTVTIAVLLVAAVASSATLLDETEDRNQEDVDGGDDDVDSPSGDLPSAGLRRLVARYNLPTCEKDPKVCYIGGTAGKDCCSKRCVDVKTDRFNCGECGRRCKFTESCCKGRCVNLAFDKGNCGKCGNKCRRGSYCIYGMCGYV
ncbi:unnamed protein product [Victoria cruziana]